MMDGTVTELLAEPEEASIKWAGPLTGEEMRVRLGIACCALDKIAKWEAGDDVGFGGRSLFAEIAMMKITDAGEAKPKNEDRMPTCAVCWWMRGGMCKMGPPGIGEMGEAVFPIVDGNDWCGQFKELKK